jgi:hypothetical protein
MSEKKPARDWEAIERDYRTGAFTDRELGAKHGLSHTAIQKRAKDHGWQKDLKGAVKRATEAKLLNAEVARVAGDEVAKRVASQVAKALPATTEVVTAMAEVNTEVVLRHRADIRALRDEAIGLLQELGFQRENMPAYQALLESLSEDADSPADIAALRQQWHRAMGVGPRIGSVKALAEVLAKLQPLERVAFGLDDDEDPHKRAGKPMSDLELASKLAHFVDIGRRRAQEAAAA